MSEITDHILSVAKSSGFDTELKVAAILRSERWSVSQSVYYIDKDEDKGRELDALAYFGSRYTKDGEEVTCNIHLCIEVKKSAHPFIFFSNSPREYEGGTGYSMLKWMQGINNSILPYRNFVAKQPLIRPERICRSYTLSKGGGESQIKSGIISAFKAAVHWSETTEEPYNDTSKDLSLFIPILVVDAPLYECYFPDDSSELAAKKTSHLVYLQHYHSKKYKEISTRVNVVSLDYLPSLLQSYKAWSQNIVDTIKDRMASRDSAKQS